MACYNPELEIEPRTALPRYLGRYSKQGNENYIRVRLVPTLASKNVGSAMP